jgi:hypothetical protein
VGSIKDKLEIKGSNLWTKNQDLVPLLIILLIGLYFSVRICLSGFDVTDEALYILSAKFPFEQASGLGFSHVITSVFWDLSGTTFIFRLSSILFSALISVVLCLQIRDIVPKSLNFHGKKAFPVILISYLSYGSIINFSPSYNLLIAWFTPVTLLSFLGYIYSQKLGSLLINLVTTSIGLLLILNVKFPVTFSLILLIFILLIFDFERGKVRHFLRFAAVLLVFAIFLALEIVFLFKHDFNFNYFQNGFMVLQNLQKVGNGSHLIEVLLRTGKRLAYVFVFLFSILFMAQVTRRFNRSLRISLNSTLCIFLLIYFKMYYVSNANWTGQALAIHSFVLYCLWVNRKVIFANSKTATLVLSMLFLPYVMSLGTNNIYFEQTLFYLAPWGVLVSLCRVQLLPNVPLKNLFLYSGLLTYFLVTSYYMPAYGLEESYSKNSYSLDVEGFGTIHVSKHTKELFKNIAELKYSCKISTKDRFLGLQNTGGLAIPLNLIPLGNPWVNSELQVQVNLKDNHPDQGFVIASRDSALRLLQFLPAELNFPESFRYCGKVQDTRSRFYYFWKEG